MKLISSNKKCHIALILCCMYFLPIKITPMYDGDRQDDLRLTRSAIHDEKSRVTAIIERLCGSPVVNLNEKILIESEYQKPVWHILHHECDISLLEKVLDEGADPRDESYMQLLYRGYATKFIEPLLRYGANPHTKINTWHSKHDTLLNGLLLRKSTCETWAEKYKPLIIKLCTDYRVNPHFKGHDNKDAIDIAIEINEDQIAQDLQHIRWQPKKLKELCIRFIILNDPICRKVHIPSDIIEEIGNYKLRKDILHLFYKPTHAFKAPAD